MDLILWRHAEAEDGVPDTARKLTAKGEKQAQKVAAWLKDRIESPVRILVSPAVRTQQTANALTSKFETSSEVGLSTSVQRLLRVAGCPNAEGTVIVVGHQPTLGQVAAFLLTGEGAEWDVKKGAVWWFEVEDNGGEPYASLRAVIAPREA
ncbi:MAG: histidine phosphatase family protein [Deltaproteobacteria bacterium]|nr:histidine phosphatase family protein [Deltaproteobacteria bacterium]